MSTRANVVIKKTSKNGSVKYRQIYHHSDGYYSFLGHDLQDIMNEVMAKSAEEQKEILSTPLSLAEYINDLDESYEIEESRLNLHGDIEYLYVIDLNAQTITCYSVYNWSADCSSDEDFVNGIANKIVKCDFSDSQYKEEVFVHATKFTDKWDDFGECKDWDEITNDYDSSVNENFEDITDETPLEDWATSDLYQLVQESATVAQVLSKLEDELGEDTFRKALIAIAEEIQ